MAAAATLALQPLDSRHIAVLDDLAFAVVRDVFAPGGDFQRIVPGAQLPAMVMDKDLRTRLRADRAEFRARLGSLMDEYIAANQPVSGDVRDWLLDAWTAAAFSTQINIQMGPNGHVETVAAHKLPYAKPLDGIEDLLVDIGDESNIALLGFDNNFCEVKRADDWQVWLGPIRLVKLGCKTCANLKWRWIAQKDQLKGIDSQGVKPRGAIAAGTTLWGEFSDTMDLQCTCAADAKAGLHARKKPGPKPKGTKGDNNRRASGKGVKRPLEETPPSRPSNNKKRRVASSSRIVSSSRKDSSSYEPESRSPSPARQPRNSLVVPVVGPLRRRLPSETPSAPGRESSASELTPFVSSQLSSPAQSSPPRRPQEDGEVKPDLHSRSEETPTPTFPVSATLMVSAQVGGPSMLAPTPSSAQLPTPGPDQSEAAATTSVGVGTASTSTPSHSRGVATHSTPTASRGVGTVTPTRPEYASVGVAATASPSNAGRQVGHETEAMPEKPEPGKTETIADGSTNTTRNRPQEAKAILHAYSRIDELVAQVAAADRALEKKDMEISRLKAESRNEVESLRRRVEQQDAVIREDRKRWDEDRRGWEVAMRDLRDELGRSKHEYTEKLFIQREQHRQEQRDGWNAAREALVKDHREAMDEMHRLFSAKMDDDALKYTGTIERLESELRHTKEDYRRLADSVHRDHYGNGNGDPNGYYHPTGTSTPNHNRPVRPQLSDLLHPSGHNTPPVHSRPVTGTTVPESAPRHIPRAAPAPAPAPAQQPSNSFWRVSTSSSGTSSSSSQGQSHGPGPSHTPTQTQFSIGGQCYAAAAPEYDDPRMRDDQHRRHSYSHHDMHAHAHHRPRSPPPQPQPSRAHAHAYAQGRHHHYQ